MEFIVSCFVLPDAQWQELKFITILSEDFLGFSEMKSGPMQAEAGTFQSQQNISNQVCSVCWFSILFCQKYQAAGHRGD